MKMTIYQEMLSSWYFIHKKLHDTSSFLKKLLLLCNNWVILFSKLKNLKGKSKENVYFLKSTPRLDI